MSSSRSPGAGQAANRWPWPADRRSTAVAASSGVSSAQLSTSCCGASLGQPAMLGREAGGCATTGHATGGVVCEFLPTSLRVL